MLPLDAGKLKDALDEITNVSDEEIERLVKAQVYKLKQSGFELKDLQFTIFEDHEQHEYTYKAKDISFSSFEELEMHYIEHYKKQMKTMMGVSERLDIISKIDGDDAFKEGGWIKTIGRKDPLLWAVKNGKTIEGQDPLAWAVKNDKTISKLDKQELTSMLEAKETIENIRQRFAGDEKMIQVANAAEILIYNKLGKYQDEKSLASAKLTIENVQEIKKPGWGKLLTDLIRSIRKIGIDIRPKKVRGKLPSWKNYKEKKRLAKELQNVLGESKEDKVSPAPAA